MNSSSAVRSLSLGSVLAGRYRLDERLAAGGMGEVWQASDLVLGRAVAVKLLRAEYADDPTFRRRFQAEARHTAALSHPGVAQVYDFGELPHEGGRGGTPYLVMELVAGQPLSALLASGGALPADRAADIVAQAAHAVAAAHAQGIVHRDIKPANLLIASDGSVKVTDFGIARAADAVPLTGTGQIVGTPHYLAPEQVEGGQASPASDVYALGVVLYECLTGAKPFPAESPIAVAMAHLRSPVPQLPPTVPAGLRAVCAQAMAKDPGDRPSSAADLAQLLRHPPNLATVELPPAVPYEGATSTAVLSERLPQRRRLGAWRWLAAGTALLLLAGAALLAVLDGDGSTQPKARQPGGGTGTTQSRTTAPPPSQSAQQQGAAPSGVRVRADAYVGGDAEEVEAELEALGLDVREERIEGAGTPGTVKAVVPTGLLARGREVTLFVWEAPSGGSGADDPGGDGHGKAGNQGAGQSDDHVPGNSDHSGPGNSGQGSNASEGKS